MRAGGVDRGRLRVGCGACRSAWSIAGLRPASGVGSGPARPDHDASADIEPWCLSCCRDCRSVPPNQSFKPTLLRSTKPMAGRACHGFGSATQRGLTQSLGFMGDIMAFSPQEREALLSVKGVGPTVIQRLEQIGFSSLRDLAVADAVEIVTSASGLVGSTCWKNSPQARSAIQAAIDLAISRQ